MHDIAVLTIYDRIACFYSLKPFFFSSEWKRFKFYTDPERLLREDRSKTLIMVRRFIKPDVVDLELMRRLRDRYQRIAYFHDDAGAGIPRLAVLPYVDLFYAKALFKDRNLYGKELYGKELYSNYYYEKYGVTDSDWTARPTESRAEQLAKLRLSWNIGAGDYPREKLRQRSGVAMARLFGARACVPLHWGVRSAKDPVSANRGRYPVHARIGFQKRPSITYQRRLIMERIKDDPRFLTGPVSQKQFNEEASHSRIMLSPFGWGELCLRDFEAVLGGSLLLKPDMSHLETWPDVFKAGETYVPFDWDATNLVETAGRYLEDEGERRRIAGNAYTDYRDQLATIDARVREAIAEIALS